MKGRQRPPEYIRFRRTVMRDSMADRILQALRAAQQGLTRTEISALFNRYRSASAIIRALVVLRKRGLIRFEIQKTKGRSAEWEDFFRFISQDALQ
jgi:hypothetical protein